MIIKNFYFTDTQSWIEYEENGVIIRQNFNTSQETINFIQQNNLPLTYMGCCR